VRTEQSLLSHGPELRQQAEDKGDTDEQIQNPIFTALIFMSTILGKLSFIIRFDDG
jgi:hypothetical protein